MQREYLLVRSSKERVIDQDFDVNAAVCGLNETIVDQAARIVPSPDKALQIDGLGGGIDRAKAPFKRRFPFVEGNLPIAGIDTV